MEERADERGAPVTGIFLLFFGAVLLLQTMGYLPWSLWGYLWRFWPVLLIIAGLNILFRNVNIWLVSLLVLLLLGGCLAIAMYQSGYLPGRDVINLIRMLA